jgi:hypothetical protein
MAALGRSLGDIRARLDARNSPTVTSVAVPSSSGHTTVVVPVVTEAGSFSTQDPPSRRVTPRSIVMAGAVLALIVVAVFYGRRSESPGVTSNPETRVSNESAPSTPSRAGVDGHALKPVTSPNTTPRQPSPVEDRRRQRELDHIERLYAAGGRDVLAAVESALKQYPRDQAFTDWLTRVHSRAQDSAARQHQAAVDAGATLAPSFDSAAQAEREALDSTRQGITPSSIRRLWEADELFASAIDWKKDIAPTPNAGAAKPGPATEAAVRVALADLAHAYSMLSAAAVKAQYSRLSAEEARVLDRSFLDYSSYRLDFQDVRATFSGGRATVQAAMEATATLRSGEQRRATLAATFVMDSANGAWVITSASRLPN